MVHKGTGSGAPEVQEPQTSESEQLEQLIRDIGIARFVGRINSGLIDPVLGYQTVERFVARHKSVGLARHLLALFRP